MFFLNAESSDPVNKHIWAIYNDLFQPREFPQMVVNSKGILPKMALN